MECGKIEIVGDRVTISPVAGTVWMTKHQITDLFGCFVAKVVSNISDILKSGVLDESRVCRNYRYDNGNFVELYNLEIITVLAFRIQSRNAEIFRRWLMARAVSDVDDNQILIVVPWGYDTFLN